MARRRRDRGDSGVTGLPYARSERRDRVGNAVVRMIHDQAAPVPGGHLSHSPRHVVGLAAGIHENTRIQMRGQPGRELFRVLQNILVQIPGMRGEGRGLPLNRGHDGRMGMATCGTLLYTSR